jgi:hypothetical protein
MKIASIMALFAGLSCAFGQGLNPSAAGMTMKKGPLITTADVPYPPFGIDKETPLDKVEILLGFYSAKTGAGKQEILLKADGSVRLFFSKSMQDKAPKALEGHCQPETVLRLLDLMEGLGLFGLSDEVPAEGHPHGRRLLEVRLPDRMKRIALDEPGNYSVEQMIGAVKLAAGQCLPEALNHRFFPNL